MGYLEKSISRPNLAHKSSLSSSQCFTLLTDITDETTTLCSRKLNKEISRIKSPSNFSPQLKMISVFMVEVAIF